MRHLRRIPNENRVSKVVAFAAAHSDLFGMCYVNTPSLLIFDPYNETRGARISSYSG
jgi:hypothetical protein